MRAARDVCPTRLPADAAAPNLSGSGSAKSPLLRRSRPATARLASGGQETRLHQQVIAQCEEFDTCHLSSTLFAPLPARWQGRCLCLGDVIRGDLGLDRLVQFLLLLQRSHRLGGIP